MKCQILFCKNQATHFCLDCNRPICANSDEHSNACFEYHKTATIEAIIQRNKELENVG